MKKFLLGVITLVFGMTSLNAATVPTKDPATYALANGYALQNMWIMSLSTFNNPAADLKDARGMAFLNGELLFCSRNGLAGAAVKPFKPTIEVYDAATGAFKRSLPLDTVTVFRTAPDVWAGLYPNQDIQVDEGGHVLVGNMTLNAAASNFQVWNINMNDGSGTKVLDCVLEGITTGGWRIDAFAVYGNIATNGYLMAAVSGTTAGISDVVLRWDIKNGVVSQQPEYILIQTYYPITTPNNGTAPRVCPIDEHLFYLDGFNTPAAIYDMSGVLIDSFEKAMDLIPKKYGNNGVDEFTINGKNFVIYNYTNNEVEPYHSFSLAELGTGMSFTGMTGYYILPAGGLGNNSNAVRTTLPRINVSPDGKVATIYVYAYNNGLAAYKFGLEADLSTSIKTVGTGGLTLTTVSQGIVLSEIANVEVYNLVGQRVLVKPNTDRVDLESGMYVVKAVSAQGAVTSKVIIK